MNPQQALMGLMGGGHNPRSSNIFEKIIERLTLTIDQHMHFERVDDVMHTSNPFDGMTEMVTAQMKAQSGDSEEWKKEQEEKKEEAHEDKGRIHVIRRGSLTPVFSLFTVFTYVTPSLAAQKEELGWWSVTLTVRDKRIIEKYGTDLKSFTGDVFNERAFSTMLQEIQMILSYVMEIDGLSATPEVDPNIIDLGLLPYGQQMSIRQIIEPPSSM